MWLFDLFKKKEPVQPEPPNIVHPVEYEENYPLVPRDVQLRNSRLSHHTTHRAVPASARVAPLQRPFIPATPVRRAADSPSSVSSSNDGLLTGMLIGELMTDHSLTPPSSVPDASGFSGFGGGDSGGAGASDNYGGSNDSSSSDSGSYDSGSSFDSGSSSSDSGF